MLSIFSCTFYMIHCLYILFGKNVCSGPLPIFNWVTVFLILSCISSLDSLNINSLMGLWFTNIVSSFQLSPFLLTSHLFPPFPWEARSKSALHREPRHWPPVTVPIIHISVNSISLHVNCYLPPLQFHLQGQPPYPAHQKPSINICGLRTWKRQDSRALNL